MGVAVFLCILSRFQGSRLWIIAFPHSALAAENQLGWQIGLMTFP